MSLLKKNFRYFLGLMLVLLMIPMSAAASGADRNADFTHTVPRAIIQAMELQEPALRAYQNLWESFDKDELGLPVYPEHYAGEYVSGDKLVIMLVDPTEELKEEYMKRAQDSDHVIIESASYSLNYLNSLDQVARQLEEQDYRLGSYGVDRKANVFFVSVIEEDYNKLMNEQPQTLQKTTESLPVRIEPGTPNVSTAQLLENIFSAIGEEGGDDPGIRRRLHPDLIFAVAVFLPGPVFRTIVHAGRRAGERQGQKPVIGKRDVVRAPGAVEHIPVGITVCLLPERFIEHFEVIRHACCGGFRCGHQGPDPYGCRRQSR